MVREEFMAEMYAGMQYFYRTRSPCPQVTNWSKSDETRAAKYKNYYRHDPCFVFIFYGILMWLFWIIN